MKLPLWLICFCVFFCVVEYVENWDVNVTRTGAQSGRLSGTRHSQLNHWQETRPFTMRDLKKTGNKLYVKRAGSGGNRSTVRWNLHTEEYTVWRDRNVAGGKRKAWGGFIFPPFTSCLVSVRELARTNARLDSGSTQHETSCVLFSPKWI